MKLLFQVNVHDHSMNAIKPGVALLSSLVSGMMHRGPEATRRQALVATGSEIDLTALIFCQPKP